jgi:hypothetical protein
MRKHRPVASVAAGSDVEIVGAWCEHVRSVWLDAGWSLVDLPAAEPKDVVLASALDHLGIR